MAWARFISSVPEPADGIVTGDVFAPRLRHEAGGHDLGHGVGRVILGVFAAAVLVVVLDQVFEEGGVEVEFLDKDPLEAEVAPAC